MNGRCEVESGRSYFQPNPPLATSLLDNEDFRHAPAMLTALTFRCRSPCNYLQPL